MKGASGSQKSFWEGEKGSYDSCYSDEILKIFFFCEVSAKASPWILTGPPGSAWVQEAPSVSVGVTCQCSGVDKRVGC